MSWLSFWNWFALGAIWQVAREAKKQEEQTKPFKNVAFWMEALENEAFLEILAHGEKCSVEQLKAAIKDYCYYQITEKK